MKFPTMRHLMWIALFFYPTALLSETAASGTTISRENVARTISATGLPVTETQVEFLSPVPTRHANPELEILESDVAKGGVKMRLRCRPSKDCIPFYVVVTGISTATVKIPADNRSSIGHILGDRPRPVVHGGDHASLILDGARFRITMPVVVLENGNRGQKIHVASLDRKKTYEAVAIEPHLLRGTL